jgi:hypothetical protein
MAKIQRVKPEEVEDILKTEEEKPHQIKKAHIENPYGSLEALEEAKDSLTPEAYAAFKHDFERDERLASVIGGMKWADVSEAADGEVLDQQPEFDVAKNILECAEAVADYLVKSISSTHYMDGEFNVPIPNDVHYLLSERFNDHYDEESRREVFRLIEAASVYVAQLDERGRALDARINACFPARTSANEQRVPYGIKSIFLDDAPVLMGNEEPMIYARVKVQKGFV